MARVISLFLPTWSTDRLRRTATEQVFAPEKPLAVIGHDGRRRVVVALDANAFRAGLRVGTVATKAQVLVQGLLVADEDRKADEEGLEKLALWALRRYAPVVALDGRDGLIIESTGADHLHGGEEAMLRDMVTRFAEVGVDARLAIADTRGAAHALARFAGKRIAIAEPGSTEHAIATLPLGALRLPLDVVSALHVLGFRTVRDLLDQPRAPLVLRFGPELGRRIDQALGVRGELIETIRPDEIVEVRRAFGEPIGAAETIAKYIGRLAEMLCVELSRRGLGAIRLDLICRRVDGRAQSVRVGMAQPVRDPKRLTRLLSDKIETIEPGFGIELMSLAAILTQPFEQRQGISSLIEEVEPEVGDLVDTLANRIGPGRIYRASPIASDVPERSVRRIAALSPDTGASWPSHWPRPPRLLQPPESIEAIALLPDNPPVAFTWRGVRRRVKRADGPERVFGEWWKADAEAQAVRDYFRVEDESGERYWIFRAGDGEDPATGSQRWFLHGVFG